MKKRQTFALFLGTILAIGVLSGTTELWGSDGPEAPFSETPPVPEPEAPTESDARARKLKEEAREFWLLLQHKAYETHSQRSVMLSGPNGQEPLFDRWREPYATHVEISADAAQKLIDHLKADEFLARASDVNETTKVFSGWPNYTLTIGAAGGSGYRADLGWDEKTVSRINALAKVLGEDSPKAVAALEAISTSVKQHLAEAAKRKDHVPEALAGNLDRFALYLRFTPGQSGMYKNLVLSVPDFAKTWDPDYWLSARITKDDALRITKHLAAKGFFARCGTVRPCERKVLRGPRSPGYTWSIASAQWGFSVEYLGCDHQTLRRLSALRAELRGDAAKAMDVVVTLAARRLAVQQADLDDFSLVVRIADQGKIESAVLLTTGNTPWKSQGRVQTPPDNQVRIGKEMAAKIIEHLLKEGVPERAKNVRQMGAMTRTLQYILTVNEHSQDGFGEYVPLDLRTLERLDALRKTLDGDAAKAMDRLLSKLEPYRKAWKKAAVEPDAVKARAAEVEKQIQTHYMALRGGERPARQTWWEGNKEIMPLLFPHLLVSSDRDVQHEALLILRDDCGRRDFVPRIIGVLDSLMNRPKEAMDHAGSTRRLACELLAKWPDLRSVPVLLKALGDPYTRYDMSPIDGHVEHNYYAVWWEADRALRLITWANPIGDPQRALIEGTDQKSTRVAWEKWWRANGDRWLKSSTPPWEKGDRTELEWQVARLKQVQPRIRAEAAMALAQLGGDRAVRALIEARTVGPLVKVGSPAVVPLLETLKDSRPTVRRYAARVLGELQNPRALAPLAAAMSDTEEDVREEAAFALTKLGPEGTNRLLAALEDDSPQVREAAAATLYVLKDPNTVDPLIAAMKDKDSGVRYAAAYSLLHIGDRRAIEPFIAAIGDSEVWVRRYAAEGLATFGDARAVEPLIAALADEDQKVRIKAAQGLGRLRDHRARDALIRALQDPDSEIRSAAAAALGTNEEPRALDPLVTAMKDQSPSVRCASVVALGKLGDLRAVKPLTAILQDEEDYIRRAAAAALKQIANPKPAPEPTSLKQTRKTKLLPGSSSTVATLAPSTTGAVVAVAESEAQISSRNPMTFSGGMDGGSKEVMGGGSKTLVRCRQTFGISKVFVGDISTGKVELSYSFYERYERVPGPSYEEMAIPSKARVILLLDADRRILKAMPDTPENRKAVETLLDDRHTTPEPKAPSRLLYYRWSGVSPGAGFSNTSLSAFELDLENQRVRRLRKYARRPQPMLPYAEEQIVALIERGEWEPLSKEDYNSIKSAVSAWLRTEPPEVYSRLGILGHEDGRAESIITFFGDAKQTTRIDLSPGRPNEPPRPPTQCDALIEAVMPRPKGLQPAEPAPPELNVVTHFKLILRFNPAHGTRPDKFPTIEFSTEPMLPKPYPPGYRFVQITPPQATKLYDHLKQTGFFNRRERDPKKETTPSYSMRSSGPLSPHFEYLGWGPPLIKRLTGLRKVLDEEVAKPVDQLRGALSKADVDALLAKIRDVLPEGWEATLYWDPEDPEFTPLRVGSLDERWRNWLPGMDGRRIEIRRKKAVHFEMEFGGPGPAGDYMVTKEIEYLRFALTLGDARQKEETHRRLAELENKIKRLETVLKPSFLRRENDGHVRHTVPRDDKGRRAAQEYDLLWATKRWFPQWSEGNVSVGFHSLIWLRFLPEDAKVEYRQVKEKVLGTLRPVQDGGISLLMRNETGLFGPTRAEKTSD